MTDRDIQDRLATISKLQQTMEGAQFAWTDINENIDAETAIQRRQTNDKASLAISQWALAWQEFATDCKNASQPLLHKLYEAYASESIAWEHATAVYECIPENYKLRDAEQAKLRYASKVREAVQIKIIMRYSHDIIS